MNTERLVTLGDPMFEDIVDILIVFDISDIIFEDCIIGYFNS